MFRKIEDLSKPTLLSKTGIKDIRTGLLAQYPNFAPIADEVLPKKAVYTSYRLRSEYKLDIIQIDKEILFFVKENLVYPHLRLLHKYPDMLPRQQIDQGGLKHIFGGSDVMAPGLTSPGGILNDAKQGDIVAIYVEGKEHALAIGVMALSSEQIRKDNKGHAITNYHHLNDALWTMKV